MIRKQVNLEGLSRLYSLTAADSVDSSLTQQLEALEHFFPFVPPYEWDWN